MTMLRPLVSLFVFALAVLWSGSALADVRCVQEVLSKTVFDPGPVDGLWGKNTANAARDFLIYRDGELSVEVAKSNSDALCQTVSDEGRDYEPLTLRRYAIIIAPEMMESHRFDFANLNVGQINNKDCDIYFHQKEIGNSWSQDTMLVGNIDIIDGEIIFIDHEWFPYVWAKSKPPKYLIESNARLTLSSSKTLSGNFHYFPDDDNLDHKDVQLRDEMPTLTKEKIIKYDFDFNTKGWVGEIKISCKTKI